MNRRKETNKVFPHNKIYNMQCTVSKGFRHNKKGSVNLQNANKTRRQYKVSVYTSKRRFNYF